MCTGKNPENGAEKRNNTIFKWKQENYKSIYLLKIN